MITSVFYVVYYVKLQYMIQSVFRWLNKCSLFHKRLHTMSHRNWFSWQHRVLETGSDVVMPIDMAAMATEWQNNNIHPVPCGCFDTDSCPALSYLNVLMKRSYNEVEIFLLLFRSCLLVIRDIISVGGSSCDWELMSFFSNLSFLVFSFMLAQVCHYHKVKNGPERGICTVFFNHALN